VDDRFSLDTATVRRSFNAAAANFDSAAVLHREVRQRALDRLKFLRDAPAVILDLGAGTGQSSGWLKTEYPQARVLAIDSALGMVQRHRQHIGAWRRLLGRGQELICADARALPLRDASVDWIFANLLIPWCGSPERLFAEALRVLKPGGSLHFSSVGPDTLVELRRAWASVDNGEHVHPFIDMHDLGSALTQSGFAEPVLDVERFTLTYSDFEALRRDLKSTGSRNALPRRTRGLYGRRTLAQLAAAYDLLRQDGKLPASVEVIYGHAWRVDRPAKSPGDGEFRISIDSIRGRR